MTDKKNIKIELPKAREIKLYLPILSLIAAGMLFYVGKSNKVILIIGAITLGFALKSLKDERARSNRANKYYNEVIKTMGPGKNRDVLKKLKEGLEIDRTNPHINYGLVMINYQNRNYTEVLKYIDNIDLKRVKKDSNLVLDKEIVNSLKGTALYESKEYQGAINLLEPIMDSHNVYKIIVALSYRELGQIEKSLEVLESGTIEGSSQQDEVAFDYWKGVNLFDLDRKEEAKNRLEKVIEIDENYGEVKKYMGRLK